MKPSIEVKACTDPRIIAEVLQSSLPDQDIDERRIASQVLLDPNFRDGGSLLALVDGKPAGYCWSVSRQVPLENAADDRDRGYIVVIGRLPGFRAHGIGDALMDAAEAYLRSNGCKSFWVSPYAPGYFAPGVDEAAYASGLDFLFRRGYSVRSRPLAMELSLAELAIPGHIAARQTGTQKEYEFHSFTPKWTVPLIRFAEDEFAGDWVRFARDAAKAILRGDDPGRLQIAEREGKVVGFSHYEKGRFGPIGVSKETEGKGVGSVLMLRTLRAMIASGHERAWFLWTDDPTANRFYTPWGWKVWKRFSILAKDAGEDC